MDKKNSKRDNSLATHIDEAISKQEKILYISKDPKKQKLYEELLTKYDAVLKRLAKN